MPATRRVRQLTILLALAALLAGAVGTGATGAAAGAAAATRPARLSQLRPVAVTLVTGDKVLVRRPLRPPVRLERRPGGRPGVPPVPQGRLQASATDPFLEVTVPAAAARYRLERDLDLDGLTGLANRSLTRWWFTSGSPGGSDPYGLLPLLGVDYQASPLGAATAPWPAGHRRPGRGQAGRGHAEPGGRHPPVVLDR